MDLAAQSRVGSLEADQARPYAPYGKACLNCVKSKTRCASSSVGRKCERCYRLNKDCQPAQTARKKRVSKRPTSPTSMKTAALEEKLDGIVQMLQRSQTSIPGIGRTQGQIQNKSINLGAFDCQTLASSGVRDANQMSQCVNSARATHGYGQFLAADDSFSMSGENLDGISQGHGQTSRANVGQEGLNRFPVNGPPTPATPTVPDRLEISADYLLESEVELEEYLEIYRTKMVPYFPLVCISGTTTVERLRNERPFLFLVIRTICSKNLERQIALVAHIKKFLGREMFEGTKNLDVLLGVLVFAAWCHFYICIKPVNSTIIQLGISLAFDLGLMRPCDPPRILLNYTAQGCPKPVNAMKERTLEERRAAVGLYLISSVFATFFQRIEFMRWTRYFDECLNVLEEKKEYPTDNLLVHLVRLQLICNKGSALTLNDALGDADVGVPTDLYVKTLKSQLDNLKHSVYPELASNVTLQLHILNTTLTIHEYSLSTTSKPTSYDPTAQLQRIESLWICLTTVKSWFTLFFSPESFPLSSYPHVSMAILTQMGHCLIALFRLGTFEAPDIPWDRQRVRREIDLGDTVKHIVDNWEQVPLVAGIITSSRLMRERGDGQLWEGSWIHAMKTLSVVKSCWEAKVAAMDAADAEREGGPRPEDNGAVNGLDISGSQQIDSLEFGGMNVDMLDDTWIKDMFGGYDFNL